jgi:hypothetical protein
MVLGKPQILAGNLGQPDCDRSELFRTSPQKFVQASTRIVRPYISCPTPAMMAFEIYRNQPVTLVGPLPPLIADP